MRQKLTGRSDEASSLSFSDFCQHLGRIRVYGGVVDEELALDVALQRRLQDCLNGLVIAQAGEDDVRLGHGLVDGLGHHDLAAVLLCEVFGHGYGPVVDDQGILEIALCGEILGYALYSR